MSNKEIKYYSKSIMQKNWSRLVGVYALFTTILSCLSGYGLIVLVGQGPLASGYIDINKKALSNQEFRFVDFFKGFKKFGRYFGVAVLQYIYIFLWSLLFIIPGIIMSYAYKMSLYIAMDYPELSFSEAVKTSKIWMRGNKWRLFCLMLRFLGWDILALITFGVTDILYSGPYKNLALAKFYLELRDEIDPEYTERNTNNNTATSSTPDVVDAICISENNETSIDEQTNNSTQENTNVDDIHTNQAGEKLDDNHEDFSVNYCPECGKKIDNGSVFCTFCGKKIM